ncbi:MAG: hypothetical protein ABOK23_07070 [Candidatus Methanoperedens sp.]|nr:hypothetical protein [Candidatus Methanoperedens sp.]MCZ7396204.1 hypothetical protein [Candidatus Methanoperedens sp.]
MNLYTITKEYDSEGRKMNEKLSLDKDDLVIVIVIIVVFLVVVGVGWLLLSH